MENKDAVTIKTEHMKKRAKERIGLNRDGTNSFVKKAEQRGIRIEDTADSPYLYSYLKNILGRSETKHLVLFNGYILVYKNNICMTVLKLPTIYKKYVERLNKKRKNGDQQP